MKPKTNRARVGVVRAVAASVAMAALAAVLAAAAAIAGKRLALFAGREPRPGAIRAFLLFELCSRCQQNLRTD